MEVGIRELRNSLREVLKNVQVGTEVIVTDRGIPVAKISPISNGRSLERLVSEGLVTLAAKPKGRAPTSRVKANGTVSDLVSLQR